MKFRSLIASLVNCSEGRLGSVVEELLNTRVHAQLLARGLHHWAVVEHLSPSIVHRLELLRHGVVLDVGGVVVAEDLEVSREGRVSSYMAPALSLHLLFHSNTSTISCNRRNILNN